MGDGVAVSGAQEELTRVAERLGAPVWGSTPPRPTSTPRTRCTAGSSATCSARTAPGWSVTPTAS
ncbi:hypothetical protein ACFQ3Z_03605 [Streptomyces nogalater]